MSLLPGIIRLAANSHGDQRLCGTAHGLELPHRADGHDDRLAALARPVLPSTSSPTAASHLFAVDDVNGVDESASSSTRQMSTSAPP
ncbi:hypothetical protein [Streptomyces thermoalcalitolerans]|uniref:Uncharacterized protein n=1 Tax=Streptomyces thermoalcalitolerans TaxID=65605 RepID=A0ABP3ZEG0_9ACTN